VDSHCHLQHAAFDDDRDAVIQRARQAGIVRILVPGWDPDSSEAALQLAATNPDLLVAAVGVHPHDAAATGEAGWARIEALASDPRCVAVGEIGLDFYRNLSPPEVQREALARQLALAGGLGKPVVIHDRDAHDEIRDTLIAWAGRGAAPERPLRGVLHCFSGDEPLAAALAAAGFVVSFALPVSFRSATGPRAAAIALPEEAILVETDAPFLGPVAGGRNEPSTVLRVATEVARLRGTTPEMIADQAAKALHRLLGSG
jgi:TatD DNase family protein